MTLRNFQKWAFIAFLVAMPLAWNSTGGDLRQHQEMCFRFLAMILIAAFVGDIWLTLFFWLNVVLFHFNGSDVGSNYVTNLFIGYLLFCTSRRFFQKVNPDEIFRWLLIVMGINILWMVFQHFGIDPAFSAVDGQQQLADRPFNDMTGIFGIKAVNGIFTAICVAVLARYNLLLPIPLFYVIWLSQSSVAMVSATAAYLFMIYFRIPKKWFAGLVLLGVLSGGAYLLKDGLTDPKMFGSRFNIWHATFKYSLARPIGYGPDSFRNTTPHKDFLFAGDEDRRAAIMVPIDKDSAGFMYYDPDSYKMKHNYNDIVPKSPNFWDNAHNEYLMAFFEFGIPGLIIMICWLLSLWARFKSATQTRTFQMVTAMMLVFFVSSLTHFPFHLARIGYLFPIILGAFYSLTERKTLASA